MICALISTSLSEMQCLVKISTSSARNHHLVRQTMKRGRQHYRPGDAHARECAQKFRILTLTLTRIFCEQFLSGLPITLHCAQTRSSADRLTPVRSNYIEEEAMHPGRLTK